MDNWPYTEELRAQLGRARIGRGRRDRDRDIARLLSPWRRHGSTDGVPRRD